MAQATFSVGIPLGKLAPLQQDAASLGDSKSSPRQGDQAAKNQQASKHAKRSWTATGFRNFVSKFQPTNYSMLLFRTVNRDLCLPNANEDYIAPLFRDQLMPVRGWVNRSIPIMLSIFKNGVEDVEYGVPGVCNFVDARTKWLDGAVKAALDEGFTQVVCIAAGYDTRAYRFYRQGVTFFEIDLPWASQKKQQLVKAALPPPETLPRPTYIGADLSKVTLAEALAGSSFSPAKKTIFTCEGLIYYLPAEAVEKLIASVGGLGCSGSRLLFDFLRQDALDGTATFAGYANCAETCSLKKEPFTSGLQPDAASMKSYLAPLGFQLGRVWSAREMVTRQLPHTQWNDEVPPIMACYGYAEAVKPDAVPAVATQAASAPEGVREMHKED